MRSRDFHQIITRSSDYFPFGFDQASTSGRENLKNRALFLNFEWNLIRVYQWPCSKKKKKKNFFRKAFSFLLLLSYGAENQITSLGCKQTSVVLLASTVHPDYRAYLETVERASSGRGKNIGIRFAVVDRYNSKTPIPCNYIISYKCRTNDLSSWSTILRLFVIFQIGRH